MRKFIFKPDITLYSGVLVTKDTKLVTKPVFEFIEFSKIESKYKELFELLINKCIEENAVSCSI